MADLPDPSSAASRLAPLLPHRFVVHACLIEQSGGALQLTLPTPGLTWRGSQAGPGGAPLWTEPAPLFAGPALSARPISIHCSGAQRSQLEPGSYPPAARFAGVELVFLGGAAFSRRLVGGAAVLLAEGSVLSIDGLPAGVSWRGFSSIELAGARVQPLTGSLPSASSAALLRRPGAGLLDGGAGTGPHQPYP